MPNDLSGLWVSVLHTAIHSLDAFIVRASVIKAAMLERSYNDDFHTASSHEDNRKIRG